MRRKAYFSRNQGRGRAAKPQSRKGGDQRLIRRSSEEKVGVFRSKPSEADGERPEPTPRRRGRSTPGSRRDRPKDADLLQDDSDRAVIRAEYILTNKGSL